MKLENISEGVSFTVSFATDGNVFLTWPDLQPIPSLPVAIEHHPEEIQQGICTTCVRYIYWKSLPLFLLLSACSSVPVVVTQKVEVPTFIPIPTDLTTWQPLIYSDGATYGTVEGVLYTGLQACRADLNAIRDLKPPKTSPSVPPQPKSP